MTENIKDGLDYHQDLMTKAYEGYKSGMAYEDFIGTLDVQQRTAVLIGNLEYQVCNGGFHQWHDNGYSKEIDELLKTLKGMSTECPLASQVHDLVFKAKKNIQEAENLSESDFEDYNSRYHDYDDFEDDEEYEEEEDNSYELYQDAYDDLLRMEGLDDAYYAIMEPWLVQVEFHLRRQAGMEISIDLLETYKEELTAGKKDPAEGADPIPQILKPVVKLTGSNGDALAIVSKVKRALRDAGTPREIIDLYQKEALSGDYNNVLVTSMKYADVR